MKPDFTLGYIARALISIADYCASIDSGQMLYLRELNCVLAAGLLSKSNSSGYSIVYTVAYPLRHMLEQYTMQSCSGLEKRLR